MDDDNRDRAFHELVDDIQMRQAKIDQQKVRQHNPNSKMGEAILRGFKEVEGSRTLNFTIEYMDDRSNFELWMEQHAEPYFMHICSADSHHITSLRSYGKDLMILSKWMKAHNVSNEAVSAFDKFRQNTIWQYLGAKALPTTQQRGQQERFYTPEQLMAIKDRIFDLATNPDATPLTMDYKKKGEFVVAGDLIIKQLHAAYHLAKNITSRSGELRWIRVGDIDFRMEQLPRYVAKPSAGNFGDDMVENLWPTTIEPLVDYLSSRRERRFKLPDAPIFSDRVRIIGAVCAKRCAWRCLGQKHEPSLYLKEYGCHYNA